MVDVVLRVDSLQKSVNSNHLAQVLKQVSGVMAVSIETNMDQVAVSFDPLKVDTFGLVTAIQEAGYDVQTQAITLLVDDMTCASCAFHVETALTDVPGVVTAEVDLPTGQTAVTVTDKTISMERLHHAVIEAGYKIRQLEQI